MRWSLVLVVVIGCGDNRRPAPDAPERDDAATAVCGDGVVAADEACDDGNATDTDDCSTSCKPARCGDGVLHIGSERCDTGGGTLYCDAQCRPAIVQIAAGFAHTCARLATGAIRCWGFGADGALGYGNTDTIGDPVLPRAAGDVPVGGVVVQIAAYEDHTCAVLDTGGVRCWGFNNNGVLGYQATDASKILIGDTETPASMGDISLPAHAVQVATGDTHTCALLDTGAVRCWGLNGAGQLGYPNKLFEGPGTAGDVSLGGSVVQLVAGAGHTCALLTNGAVRCWGANQYGQLGYGQPYNVGDDETPASYGDVPVGGRVAQLAAGTYHTCAVLDTGAVRCWGLAIWGQLGYGNASTIGDDEPAASAGDVPIGERVAQVSAGEDFTCARLVSGRVRCWGDGTLGQLGYGATNTIPDASTAFDVRLGELAVEIASSPSGGHTCALVANGAVRCWGICGNGRCGYGNSANIGDDDTPAIAGNVPVL